MVVVAELTPQLSDTMHKRVISYRNVVPYGIEQLLLGDQTTCSRCKIGHHAECLGSQLNVLAAPQQATAIQVKREAVEGSNPSSNMSHSLRSLATISVKGRQNVGKNSWLRHLTNGTT
jgi:hypothetical protein